MELPLDHVASTEFEQPNAEQAIRGRMPAPEKPPRKTRRPAGLPPYLASLYDVALLTAEQEVHLFRKYNYLKYRAAKLREQLNPQSPQSRLMDQIEQLYEEAVGTKKQIIRANLRLVVSVVKRYATEPDQIFELISEGNVSLMRAVEKFDYSRGFKFSTYATWAIKKNHARWFVAEVKRRDRFRTTPDEMLADEPELRADPHVQEIAQENRKTQIDKILVGLDDRERGIITSRFGLGPSQDSKTLKEVGEELGVSKERIRQLERRALGKLRVAARDAGIEEPEAA